MQLLPQTILKLFLLKASTCCPSKPSFICRAVGGKLFTLRCSAVFTVFNKKGNFKNDTWFPLNGPQRFITGDVWHWIQGEVCIAAVQLCFTSGSLVLCVPVQLISCFSMSTKYLLSLGKKNKDKKPTKKPHMYRGSKDYL